MARARIRAAAAIAVAGVAGAAAGAGVHAAVDGGAPQGAGAPVRATPAASVAATSWVTDVWARAADGVVEISTRGAAPEDPFGFDRVQQGVGSGFVYDADGHVVTNHHVVQGADTVTVAFADRTERRARVVGSDPSTDLAVLEVDGAGPAPTPLALAPTATVEVGEPVVAIGSPFGLEGTVTAGIVSALDRRIQAPDGFPIAGAIQTDAAINQGNSGGPLLDAEGRVIGVNAQIESGNGGNVGLGFAIPGDTVRTVVEQLLERGQVEHAYLGVEIADVPAAAARELGGPGAAAVAVTAVTPGSPADEAGLRAATGSETIGGVAYPAGGDLVAAVDGEPVGTASQLQAAIAGKRPGDRVTLAVWSGGERRQVEVTLARRPS